jgi:hypothetical protein
MTAILALALALHVSELRAGEESTSCKATPETVLDSEELLEKLRVPLATLSRAVAARDFPNGKARAYLAPAVEVVDLEPRPSPRGERIVDIGAVRRAWPVAKQGRTVRTQELSLWRPFLATVERFEHFGFYNIRGAFEGEAFRTVTGFQGLAKLRSGALAHVKGRASIVWHRSDAAGCAAVGWRIAALRTESFRLTETERALFEDVLPLSVSGSERRRLERSKRDEALVAWISGMRNGDTTFEESGAEILENYRAGTEPVPAGQISVIDLDRDGYDDFYVTASTDRALLYRNRRDGTFEEVGARYGLDLENVHAVVFADFDNDGDKDAFVSYLVNGTRYLEQKDGRFAERRDAVAGPTPSWAVCMAVADYDNDGLLDVYFGAWAGTFVGFIAADRVDAQRKGQPVDLSFPGLSDREGRELTRRLLDEAADPVLARPGPPNVLLKNLGDGRFARAPNCGNVQVYYNTLATTWSDYDRDGDADLYVTNEGGPNQLFRNRGDGTFEDISDAVTGEVGYGMGATWGDYDNDGRLDLYVTNMYSKAGIRIAGQLQAAEAVQASARGNSLLRNRGGSFERIADTPVEAADFGWGGAFADFNNDGRLDIYAPAGYVTIPEEVATVGDT